MGSYGDTLHAGDPMCGPLGVARERIISESNAEPMTPTAHAVSPSSIAFGPLDSVRCTSPRGDLQRAPLETVEEWLCSQGVSDPERSEPSQGLGTRRHANSSMCPSVQLKMTKRKTKTKPSLEGAAGHASSMFVYEPEGSISMTDLCMWRSRARGPTPTTCGKRASLLQSQDKLPLESGTSILKRLDEDELEVYERLRSLRAEDPIHDFVPHLVGVVEEVDEDDEVKSRFLRISNLCYPFTRPKVIDVKLGIRTFLEHECENECVRPDLFKKMLREYPNEVQEHERDLQAVTKHRWMTVRDANSTTSRLGFRIDGVAGYDAATKEAVRVGFLKCRTMEDSIMALRRIVEDVSSEGLDETGWTSPGELAGRFVQRLNVLRSAFEASEFLRTSECIGSSVMHVVDHTGRVDVFWIDFAKVRPAKERALNHRDVWTMGNHEDGVLLGLDNLIDTWTEVWRPSGNVRF